MVSSPAVTVLLFNAAKVLVEQQINVKIESIHFMDGWVHLNTQDTKTIDIEIGHIQEEITSMQDLRQRVNVGERDAGRNNSYSGIGMDCDPGLTFQQKSRDQMQTVDRISNHNGKDISEADINAFPVTPTLQFSSSSSSQYLYPSLSRIADECIDNDVQSPSASSTQSSEDSVEITKPSRNRFGSVTRTLVRRQPVRNVISAYASHPYPQPRRRKASVKICKK